MHPVNRNSTVARYFSGLTEQTFQSQLGVVDTELIDYISDLLVRFIHNDDIFKIRDLSGKRVDAIGQMLREADARIGQARREIHQHIGDFTLFWTGLYPEALQPGRSSSEERSETSPPSNYAVLGKRAYFIASTIPLDPQKDASGDLLSRLSDRFELCAYGLREVRREWERRDDDEGSPRPFLIN